MILMKQKQSNSKINMKYLNKIIVQMVKLSDKLLPFLRFAVIKNKF